MFSFLFYVLFFFYAFTVEKSTYIQLKKLYKSEKIEKKTFD